MTQTNAHEKRRHKEQLYELFAQVATAMANPHRLELIDLLVQAPRTVDELAQEAHMSIANTSQHLQRLKQARLVMDEREGLYVRYRIADPSVSRLWIDLRALADLQLADVERVLNLYRDRRHEFHALTPAEVQERLRQNEAVLLDVRPSVEYEAAHIPGALSIPYNELEGRLSELPSGKLIVTYCRGPYCVYADDVLGTLAKYGWQVARLEEGVVEWQLAANAQN
jgi:rhodanese-related sulfurtransferase